MAHRDPLHAVWTRADTAAVQLHDARQVYKGVELATEFFLMLAFGVAAGVTAYKTTAKATSSGLTGALVAAASSGVVALAGSTLVAGSKPFHRYVHRNRNVLNDAANECKSVRERAKWEVLLGDAVDPQTRADELGLELDRIWSTAKPVYEAVQPWEERWFGLAQQLPTTLGVERGKPQTWSEIKSTTPAFAAQEVLNDIEKAAGKFEKKVTKYDGDLPKFVDFVLGVLPDTFAVKGARKTLEHLSEYSKWRHEVYKGVAQKTRELATSSKKSFQEVSGKPNELRSAILNAAERMQGIYDECNASWTARARERVA